MTYKRRGAIRFVLIGRFGFSFWWRKRKLDKFEQYWQEQCEPAMHRVEGSLAEFNRYVAGDR